MATGKIPPPNHKDHTFMLEWAVFVIRDGIRDGPFLGYLPRHVDGVALPEDVEVDLS